jgi:hypothetical protein
MRVARFAAIATLGAGLFGCSSQSDLAEPTADLRVSSTGMINEERIPTSGVVINQCNGEDVAFAGFFHTHSKVTVTPSGATHIEFETNTQEMSAVGLSTGVAYNFSERGHDSFNSKGLAVEQTVTHRTSVIGHGKVPNFIVIFDIHITVNAKGLLTSSFFNFRSTCH